MKKNFLLIVTFSLITVFQNSLFAQYATEQQSNETQELLYNQNKVSQEIGKGVQMAEAGMAIMLTGASITMSGLTCYIYDMVMSANVEGKSYIPAATIVGLLGAGAGGLITLIGLPFYINGMEKMTRYGSSYFIFGNEGHKGVTGFLEMGLGLTTLNIDAVGGYNFGKNFFMGAGLGYKTFYNFDFRASMLQIYANCRYSIGDKRVVPYIGASVGYDITTNGLYTGLELGTRFRKIEAKRGASWWLAAKPEFFLKDGMCLSLKVGRSF